MQTKSQGPNQHKRCRNHHAKVGTLVFRVANDEDGNLRENEAERPLDVDVAVVAVSEDLAPEE